MDDTAAIMLLLETTLLPRLARIGALLFYSSSLLVFALYTKAAATTCFLNGRLGCVTGYHADRGGLHYPEYVRMRHCISGRYSVSFLGAAVFVSCSDQGACPH